MTAHSSCKVRVVGRIRPMAEYERNQGSSEVVTRRDDGGPGNSDSSTIPAVLAATSGSDDNKEFPLDALLDGT